MADLKASASSSLIPSLPSFASLHHHSSHSSLTHSSSATAPSAQITSGPSAKSSFDNSREKRKENPQLGLHAACVQGNLGLVKFALDRGQRVDDYLNGMILPIHAASCSPSSAPVVEYLIRRGADVNAPRPSRKHSTDKSKHITSVGTTGATALHFAAANGCYQTALVLLSNGADPNAADKYGSTPLTFAMAKKHHDIVNLLTQFGCRRTNGDEATPGMPFTSDSEEDIERENTIGSHSPILVPQNSPTASRLSLTRRRSKGSKSHQKNPSLHSIFEKSTPIAVPISDSRTSGLIGSDEDSESTESDFEGKNGNAASKLRVATSTQHPLANELKIPRGNNVPPLSPPESFRYKSASETSDDDDDEGTSPPSPSTLPPSYVSDSSASSMVSPLGDLAPRKSTSSQGKVPPLPPNAAEIAAAHKYQTDMPESPLVQMATINIDPGTPPLGSPTSPRSPRLRHGRHMSDSGVKGDDENGATLTAAQPKRSKSLLSSVKEVLRRS